MRRGGTLTHRRPPHGTPTPGFCACAPRRGVGGAPVAGPIPQRPPRQQALTWLPSEPPSCGSETNAWLGVAAAPRLPRVRQGPGAGANCGRGLTKAARGPAYRGRSGGAGRAGAGPGAAVRAEARLGRGPGPWWGPRLKRGEAGLGAAGRAQTEARRGRAGGRGERRPKGSRPGWGRGRGQAWERGAAGRARRAGLEVQLRPEGGGIGASHSLGVKARSS